MAVEIQQPFRVFTDVDGEPLEDGFIHIGAVNQNPQVVPISVFWDQDMTIPAAQPIRTLGGYPSRSGTPSRMYVAESEYSISVSNKNSTLIYSDLNNRAGIPVRFSEFPFVTDFGANGDGVADNVTPFTDAAANSKLTFIPKPAVKYLFSAPVGPSAGTWLPDPGQTWDQLTDGGQLNLWRGRTTGLPTGSNIWRLSDRVFIGYGASAYAGDNHNLPDGGNSWLNDATDGPAYLPANAGVLFMSGPGDTNTLAHNQPYGFVAAIRTSDLGGSRPIGFGAAIIHDTAVDGAWGAIYELQREPGAGKINGIEIAAKNKGSNGVCTPNSLVSGGPPGIYGVWAQGGGDAAFGGSSTAPSTAALAVLSGDNTWNSGVVIARDGLTSGNAIELSSEGIGGAHSIKWYTSAGGVALNLRSSATDTNAWVVDRNNNGFVVSKSANPLLTIGGPDSNVNGLTVFGAAAGGSPQLSASGTDANIDLQLTPKGTGLVRFGTFTASGDVAVIGSISIKDAAGTIRKVAVVA